LRCDWSVQRKPSSPMPATMYAIAKNTKVRFCYPFINPTLDFQIRVPELNDTRTVNAPTVTATSRGNFFLSIRDPIWPIVQTIVVTFMYLSDTELENVKQLCIQSIGKPIKYVDYESKIWQAWIINPNSERSQERVLCGGSVQLQMEVEEV
jgi:hypothetical protein